MPHPRALLPMNKVTFRYLAGESPRALAEIYGVTDNTIRANLRRAGVVMRTLSQSQSIWQKGIPKTIEQRRSLSLAKIGKPAPKPPGFGKHLSKRMRGLVGPAHPSWTGGSEPLRNAIRRWSEYKEWRDAVYLRDSYTCLECGQRGGELQAHHKKPVNRILRDENVKTHDQALACKPLWDIENGMTVCSVCHPKIERKTYEC